MVRRYCIMSSCMHLDIFLTTAIFVDLKMLGMDLTRNVDDYSPKS